MATFHCSVKIGAKGKGGSHSEYITREGKYSKENASRYEDLEASGSGNMPKWSVENPTHFWQAADQYERANGSVYREIVVALPRELNPDQRLELLQDFIHQEIGTKHAYTWAIHTPKAALEKGDQPHAHIMYSERILDGIERDPAHFFKRANKKNPEKGGCVKASGGKSPAELKTELLQTRERWANIQNSHLEKHGHEARVTHLSLKDQGIDRQPEKHLGAKGVQRLSQDDITSLLERRKAEGELERERQEVGLIDLSGNIEKAKQESTSITHTIDTGKDDIRAMFEQYKKEEQAKKEAELIKAKEAELKSVEQEKEKVQPKFETALKQVREQPTRHRTPTRDDDYGMSL